MMGPKNCDRCARMCYSRVCIGDTAYGNSVYDQYCPEWDSMSDAEVKLSNIGQCPRFVVRVMEENDQSVEQESERMAELKPCPFCGGLVGLATNAPFPEGKFWAECLRCGIQTRAVSR